MDFHNSTHAKNVYGTIVLRDQASAQLGDTHIHVYIDEIGGLKDLLHCAGALALSPSDYEHTIAHLDTLSFILLQIQQICSSASREDDELVQSLQVEIHTILKYVREQARLLQGCDNHDTANIHDGSPLHSADRRFRAADEVVRSLHHYLNSQLLSLQIVLHLLLFKADKRRARLESTRHDELRNRNQAQIEQLLEIQSSLESSFTNAQYNQQTLQRLAEQALLQAKSANSLEPSLTRLPALSNHDCIRLTDALKRPFRLPFSDFQDFEVFESFLRQQFDPQSVPGGRSVAAGRYLITTNNNPMRAATDANWKLMIYPGCKLTMSVVLNFLSLSILQCPRPSCGQINNDITQHEGYTTCRKCGLQYRYDRSILLPAAANPEDTLRSRQIEQDRQEFGPIDVPVEVFENVLDNDITGLTMSSPVDRYQQTPLRENASEVYQPSTQAELPAVPKIYRTQQLHTAGLDDEIANDDDQYDSHAIESWRHDVTPPPNTYIIRNLDDIVRQVQQQQKETRDLESLQNVLFVELAPTTEKLVQRSPNFTGMPLKTQIHFRKIVDKYPALSPGVAERLAESNVRRSHQLAEKRIKAEYQYKKSRSSLFRRIFGTKSKG